jgi:hypothetical protein
MRFVFGKDPKSDIQRSFRARQLQTSIHLDGTQRQAAAEALMDGKSWTNSWLGNMNISSDVQLRVTRLFAERL